MSDLSTIHVSSLPVDSFPRVSMYLTDLLRSIESEIKNKFIGHIYHWQLFIAPAKEVTNWLEPFQSIGTPSNYAGVIYIFETEEHKIEFIRRTDKQLYQLMFSDPAEYEELTKIEKL